MSKPKWTPGPWSVFDADDSLLVRDENDGFIVDAKNGHWNDDGEYAQSSESAPNARLIATAPELYEALADCVEALAHIESIGMRVNPPTLHKARAALAKARGES
jgi:hypothetical protein